MQKTVIKEAPKRKPETMEEINKLEKELNEAKKTEHVMQSQMAQRSTGGESESGDARKVNGANSSEGERQRTTGEGGCPGRAIRLGWRGGKVFTKSTPSTHIRNLMRKENAQRDTEASLRNRDALERRLAQTGTPTLD